MATLTMKAQVTNKYTLYIDQVTKPPADNPWAREVPGTWVWWLLDEHGKFLSSPTYEVGFGPYNETYKGASQKTEKIVRQATGSGP